MAREHTGLVLLVARSQDDSSDVWIESRHDSPDLAKAAFKHQARDPNAGTLTWVYMVPEIVDLVTGKWYVLEREVPQLVWAEKPASVDA